MGDYTQVTFVATAAEKANVEKILSSHWDAFSIRDVGTFQGDLITWRLIISELTLKESIGFLDMLKHKNKRLVFVIEYGVY